MIDMRVVKDGSVEEIVSELSNSNRSDDPMLQSCRDDACRRPEFSGV